VSTKVSAEKDCPEAEALQKAIKTKIKIKLEIFIKSWFTDERDSVTNSLFLNVKKISRYRQNEYVSGIK